MPGFGPIGSIPVGATTNDSGGTYASPATGMLILSGFTPTPVGANPALVYQLSREVVLSEDGKLAVYQVVRELLIDTPQATATVYQVVREILMDPPIIISSEDDSHVFIIWG